MAKRRRPQGVSPNPMTNLILTDIALRSVGRVMRGMTERSLLRTRYDSATADRVVKGRSLGQALVSAALARVATRSVPGALAVGGGLFAKALLDRSKGRREARREGRKALAERVANAED